VDGSGHTARHQGWLSPRLPPASVTPLSCQTTSLLSLSLSLSFTHTHTHTADFSDFSSSAPRSPRPDPIITAPATCFCQQRGWFKPHSATPRDFRAPSARKSVTLSAGTPYVPTVLPTVGAMDYSHMGRSRNPFEVRPGYHRPCHLLLSTPHFSDFSSDSWSS